MVGNYDHPFLFVQGGKNNVSNRQEARRICNDR